MAQALMHDQMNDREPNPIDDTGLCLLSLDGGGVRGLSTLYILQSLMRRLNHERQKVGASALKPCELFDLIGGTSTGGLIAIMLGRLEMDVDACITAYAGLIKEVFEEKAHWGPLNWRGRVQARFDSDKLKGAIEKVIINQGYSPTEPFNDGKARGCKVFVCASAKELSGITHLRSYDIPEKPNVSATICEAALATSAATGFFDPVLIGARHFVDGALGANNPVDEVEGEATDIWCPDIGDLKPLVKCFISIGTGNPGRRAIEDNLLKFLSKTLVEITTETEETAKKFLGRWREYYDQKRYFRLNVEQGLQNVGLAEYYEQGTIETATHQYLDDQQQVFRVRDCVMNLKQKQRKSDTTLASRIQAYKHNSIRNDLNRSALPCHYIPPPKNNRFVGRQKVVDGLCEQLFTSDGVQTVTLVGLGGVGKTQVALQVAYWTEKEKPDHSVFWVPAINGMSFDQAYAEIFKMLAIRKTSEDEEVRESVRRYLQRKDSGKWLLVLDNADDREVLFGSSENPDGLYQYLPKSDEGVILVTTRTMEVAVAMGGEVVELLEMTPEESKALLTKTVVRKNLMDDEKGVTTLLEQLTYLPLAITQAGAYLSRNGISIAKYVELLHGAEQDVVQLLSREFHDPTRYLLTRYPGVRNAVATTWLVSFQQIQKTDAAAIELLSFLSCIEAKAVPRSILPPLPSEEEMVYAIGTLEGYAFLVQRGDMGMFDMHRLVHLATRIWVRREGQASQVERAAGRHLATIFPSNNYQNRGQWRLYLPHALRLLQGNETAEMSERYILCRKVGLCLRADGRIKNAVKYLEECYHWRRDNLPLNDVSRLSSQHALAMAYRANGQIKDAVSLLEEIKDAVSLLEEVVKIREQTLEPDHPDRLASQHALAVMLWEVGQRVDALQLMEHVVEERKKMLGEEHPDRKSSEAHLEYFQDELNNS
ncbi:hypothetical protein RBB50_012454 [Rhinocladiella similis]